MWSCVLIFNHMLSVSIRMCTLASCDLVCIGFPAHVLYIITILFQLLMILSYLCLCHHSNACNCRMVSVNGSSITSQVSFLHYAGHISRVLFKVHYSHAFCLVHMFFSSMKYNLMSTRHNCLSVDICFLIVV